MVMYVVAFVSLGEGSVCVFMVGESEAGWGSVSRSEFS